MVSQVPIQSFVLCPILRTFVPRPKNSSTEPFQPSPPDLHTRPVKRSVARLESERNPDAQESVETASNQFLSVI